MSGARLRELVVCSLEAYDDVWRRNQLLVAELLELEPRLRVLFVEPAVDVALELVARRRWRTGRGFGPRSEVPAGRLTTFEPTKWLPRAAGPIADQLLAAAVERRARLLGFSDPVLWVNDPAFATLVRRTGWPTLYDVTDDWLLASCTRRERDRRRRNEAYLLARAHEVTVCSPALVRTKGRHRPVRLVTNAVDAVAIRRPTLRPADLPQGSVACYVGTLHEDRLDVELCVEIARALRGRASLVLVGPDALGPASRRALAAEPAVVLLGPRPYATVPAYLQHADVLVVPHLVTPFTESLDPIKAYEYRAVGRPVVATPVAGFRGLGMPVEVATRAEFVRLLLLRLPGPAPRPRPQAPTGDLPTWRGQAGVFLDALVATSASGHAP